MTPCTQRIDTWWPTASVSWKPDAIVDVRADVDAISNDVSYTLLTPHTDVGTRVLVSVHPNDQFSIVDAMNVRHQTLDAADYTADIRGNAVTANYQVNDNFAFFGGYTFDSLKATGSDERFSGVCRPSRKPSRTTRSTTFGRQACRQSCCGDWA